MHCANCGKEKNQHIGTELICVYPFTSFELGISGELAEAWNEISCCDDIRLDQGLAVAIADLQKLRVEAEKALTRLSCGKVESKP